jgi:hypothetical protein
LLQGLKETGATKEEQESRGMAEAGGTAGTNRSVRSTYIPCSSMSSIMHRPGINNNIGEPGSRPATHAGWSGRQPGGIASSGRHPDPTSGGFARVDSTAGWQPAIATGNIIPRIVHRGRPMTYPSLGRQPLEWDWEPRKEDQVKSEVLTLEEH